MHNTYKTSFQWWHSNCSVVILNLNVGIIYFFQHARVEVESACFALTTVRSNDVCKHKTKYIQWCLQTQNKIRCTGRFVQIQSDGTTQIEISKELALTKLMQTCCDLVKAKKRKHWQYQKYKHRNKDCYWIWVILLTWNWQSDAIVFFGLIPSNSIKIPWFNSHPSSLLT